MCVCVRRCVLAAVLAVFVGAHPAWSAEWREFIPNNLLPEDWPVGTDREYADVLLNWQQHVTGKTGDQLRFYADGRLKPNKLYLSGMFKGSYMYERTNSTGRFPILARFPNQHSGDEGEHWVINNAAGAMTLNLGDWVTAYAQHEYTEIEFIGQDENQWRKYWVALGNLDRFPLYAYYGRNTIDFGDLDGFNPFTHTVNNHFFRADSDEPVLALGYDDGLFHVVATAIPGGRHLRTADSDDDGLFANFAINAEVNADLTPDIALKVGAGFLEETIYNSVIAHHPPNTPATRGENGAWDVNATLTLWNVDLMGEYGQTTASWPATDEKVVAWTAQGRYRAEPLGVPTHLSAVYSRGEVGPDGTEFESLEQIVGAAEIFLLPNISFGLEYVHNHSFVPLIAIRRASHHDTRSHTFILGTRIIF